MALLLNFIVAELGSYDYLDFCCIFDGNSASLVLLVFYWGFFWRVLS